MRKNRIPGVDSALVPRHGVSRGGQPLSYNRLPAPDLAPWIGWLYVTVVEAPADYQINCGLFNDVSLFRFQLKGRWTAQTADGELTHEHAALFFGPQSRLMPVSVTGSFISVGFALRPGTGHALLKAKTAEYIDRLVTCDSIGLPGTETLAKLYPNARPEEWLHVLEESIRQIVANAGGKTPDPITSRFEEITLADPSISVGALAKECGLTAQTLERLIRRDFGMTPKQVLRRSRALDMAASLRGVADHAEGDEMALRYYDQSHLIREFTDLFGMSPKQFVEKPLPILTLALESRQSRRLEALKRLGTDEKRPWE